MSKKTASLKAITCFVSKQQRRLCDDELVDSIGEVRDRQGGAHLNTGDVLKRFPEYPVDDVVKQRREKGAAFTDTRVDFK